jgi:hypothetical protein
VRKKDHTTNKHHLSNLLARYKSRLKPPQASVEKAVIAAVEKETGITVTSDQVTYTVFNKTVTLQLPSIIKTELKKKQSAIQTELKKTLPESEVPTFFI